MHEAGGSGNILSDAWPMLVQRLTSLAVLAAASGEFLPAPSLLTASSRLQSLFVLAPMYELQHLQRGHSRPLAPGPALPSLRHLAATLGTLVSSLPVVQAATRLEFVGAVCFASQLPGLPRLLDWAVRPPRHASPCAHRQCF